MAKKTVKMKINVRSSQKMRKSPKHAIVCSVSFFNHYYYFSSVHVYTQFTSHGCSMWTEPSENREPVR